MEVVINYLYFQLKYNYFSQIIFSSPSYSWSSTSSFLFLFFFFSTSSHDNVTYPVIRLFCDVTKTNRKGNKILLHSFLNSALHKWPALRSGRLSMRYTANRRVCHWIWGWRNFLVKDETLASHITDRVHWFSFPNIQRAALFCNPGLGHVAYLLWWLPLRESGCRNCAIGYAIPLAFSSLFVICYLNYCFTVRILSR
jgi:hypothetical protein